MVKGKLNIILFLPLCQDQNFQILGVSPCCHPEGDWLISAVAQWPLGSQTGLWQALEESVAQSTLLENCLC